MFILNFIKELLKKEVISIRGFASGFYLQCLYISSKTRNTHQAHIVDFEYSLEVSIDSHKLSGDECLLQ
jgi:hypothetical protein